MHSDVRDAMRLILADNADARERLAAEIPCLDSTGARAALWEIGRDDGTVLCVLHGDRALFPSFQFRNAAVLDAVIEVVAILGGSLSDWQIAFWFVSANRWLDGGRPMDRLYNPGAVVAAARAEVDEVIG